MTNDEFLFPSFEFKNIERPNDELRTSDRIVVKKKKNVMLIRQKINALSKRQKYFYLSKNVIICQVNMFIRQNCNFALRKIEN